MPKLWRYNLHYFDYICHSEFPTDFTASLITEWITHCPQGTPEAWEPYPASLRIVNWIKAFTQSISPQPQWLDSLYLQARWLERNIEYHILANHYLKNGVALFFAGSYFEGVEAQRWMEKGLKILSEETNEQILSDGGHFERSPMYHSIAVEDYLDVLNIMHANPGLVDRDQVKSIQASTEKALMFLKDLCLPDHDIPLFNDSTFGIAPSPSRLFEYAQRIIGYQSPPQPQALSVTKKERSGYSVIRHNQDMLIVDCGEVGPDYQPGHAHCDMLSYELALDGKRVIVDSGVHDYEAGTRRQYARSTKAHNTVVVDGHEQSEMWGTFRVAHRARPLQTSLTQKSHAAAWFEGAHSGYHRLPGKVTHHRTIEYDAVNGWLIRDEVQGSGIHLIENYIHLHPGLRIKPIGNFLHVTDLLEHSICVIEVLHETPMKIEKGWHFPEFGIEQENDVIVLTMEGRLPLRTEYRITKHS